MADIVPGAEWRPNPVSSRRIQLIWLIFHTIVGTVAGSLSGRHYHIYIRADGTFVQIQDLLLRSAASVQANPYSIAITAEDKGPAFPAWSGNNVPPYTKAQLDTVVRLIVWICRRYGIPPEAVRDTCLGGAKGTCWHRLGIDGNWPRWPSIFRGRENKACLGTSLSFGKGCPGDNRIRQINYEAIPRAIAILRGLPSSEDDMPLTDADVEKIADAVWRRQITNVGSDTPGPAEAHLRWTNHNAGVMVTNHAKVWTELGKLKASLADIKAKLTDTPPS